MWNVEALWNWCSCILDFTRKTIERITLCSLHFKASFDPCITPQRPYLFHRLSPFMHIDTVRYSVIMTNARDFVRIRKLNEKGRKLNIGNLIWVKSFNSTISTIKNTLNRKKVKLYCIVWMWMSMSTSILICPSSTNFSMSLQQFYCIYNKSSHKLCS